MRKSKGISVIVKTEAEYKKVQEFLTDTVLYVNWHTAMIDNETAIVLKADKKSDFSSGSVGLAEHQRLSGIKTMPFIENLSEYLIN